MAFTSGDPKINRRGRPRKDAEPLGVADLRRLSKLLHSLTPKAVQKIVALMEAQNTKDEVVLKAALSLIQNSVIVQREYDRKTGGGNVPDRDDDTNTESDKEPKATTLSLRVIQ